VNRDIVALCKKLSAYLPDGELITGLKPLTAGHSNETYIIEGLGAVLRLPPSTAPLLEAHDIITQARVYREVGQFKGGPPVPGIHVICEDATVLGDPFFVMDLVPGQALDDYGLPEWFTSLPDRDRSELCENWVAAIGSIGRLPPLKAFGEPATPQDQMRRWQGIALDAGCPRLATLIERLLAYSALRSGPPSPVQGDCKITNLIFHNLQVGAVLDWELGYNGEPLSDLGYLLYFFPSEFHGGVRTTRPSGMWSRDQVIPAWETASGRSADGLIWYETAEMAKMAGIYARATQIFGRKASDDARISIMSAKLDESMDIMDAMLARVAETCSQASS